MKIARFSVERPVFTTMAVLVVLLIGAIAFIRIPIDLMPDITNPTISIRTNYDNAGPEEIEELITRPVERAVAAVPGVEEVTSISSEGQSSVRIAFTWGTDLDAASNDLRDRLDRVIPNLPDDAERPTLFKFDLSAFPVLILGAYSDLDPVQAEELLDDQIRYRIERIPGVASLDIQGGLEREIHIDIDFARLQALNLPVDQVVTRIQAANVNLPAGSIQRGDADVTIRTPGEFTAIKELEETVIGTSGGAAILVRDVARIDDSWKKQTRLVRVNGKKGMRMSIQKQSGTNTVEVANRVRAELESIAVDYPQIKIVPIIDSSMYIQRSISNIRDSALHGGLLAILVLLLFLRNVRSTIIIATAIPFSVIATFALIYFCGYTLNLMTLGGLALGVGMVVDDAIVVLENIYRRHEEEHLSPVDAAILGTEEVNSAIVSSTLSTVVVFLPVVFMRGVTGVMFQQMAMVVTFSMMASLVVAVSLVPMLASHIMKDTTAGEEKRTGLGARLFDLSGRFFTWLEDSYRDIIKYCLGHRVLVVSVAAVLVVGSFLMVPLVGAELMPTTDENEVRINTEMAVGTRLEVMQAKMALIEQITRDNVPEAVSMIDTIGPSNRGSGGSNEAEIRLALTPSKERNRSSEDVAVDLRKKLAGIPGITVRTRAGVGLTVLRPSSSSTDKLAIEIRGHDLATADALALQVQDMALAIAGVSDTQISRKSGSPQEIVHIDRRKAADLGLSVEDVATALETALAGANAGTYREAGNEYGIVVRLANAETTPMTDLLNLTITSSRGEQVALKNVITLGSQEGPVMVERKNQERIVTVSANFDGRDLSEIVTDVRAGLQDIVVPRDFSIDVGGDFEEQQKSFKELALGLALALVLVYMVMACQYESIRDPFVVMFSVPFAAIGVVVALLLTNTTFNLQSYIGCIMLAGIVVKNGILLVDHTNLLRERDHLPMAEAIMEAGRRRLRPILMTASATILGLFPLALGLGEGGEAQAPLARAVIGGLISSTFITLAVVPVIYSFFTTGKLHDETT